MAAAKRIGRPRKVETAPRTKVSAIETLDDLRSLMAEVIVLARKGKLSTSHAETLCKCSSELRQIFKQMEGATSETAGAVAAELASKTLEEIYQEAAEITDGKLRLVGEES